MEFDGMDTSSLDSISMGDSDESTNEDTQDSSENDMTGKEIKLWRYWELKQTYLFVDNLDELDELEKDPITVNTINSLNRRKLHLLFDNHWDHKESWESDQWETIVGRSPYFDFGDDCRDSDEDEHVWGACKSVWDRKYYSKFDKKLALQKMKSILRNPKMANLMQFVEEGKLHFVDDRIIDTIIMLIDNGNAVPCINLIEIARFDNLINYDEPCGVNIMEAMFKNINIVEAINSMDLEKFKLITRDGQFVGGSLAKIFGNLKNIFAIHSMDNKKLTNLLQSGKLCNELLGKVNFPQSIRIEVLINHDKYYNNQKIFKNCTMWDEINFDKFQVIAESRLHDYDWLTELIESENVIDAVNLLNIDNFTSLFKIITPYGPPLTRKPSKWILHKVWDYPASKFTKDDKDMRQLVLSIFSYPEFVATVNKLETAKFEILFRKLSYNYKILHDLIDLVKNPDSFKIVQNMNVKKMQTLLKFYSIDDFTEIVECKEALGFIELFDDKKIKTILKMLVKFSDFIKICKNYKGNVKQNLSFAIALYKAEVIRTADCDFILDDNAIKDKIENTFPENFPIDQVFIPSAIKSGGRIPNLKYLALEAAIDLVEKPRRMTEYEMEQMWFVDGVCRCPQCVPSHLYGKLYPYPKALRIALKLDE